MPKVIQVRNFDAINEDEWRILNAVETGMRNHEIVSLDTVHHYAEIKFSGVGFRNLIQRSLVPQRLICFENNGYRLTNLAYDFLALRKFIKSGLVRDLTHFQFFATGKESDLYICKSGEFCQESFGIEPNIPIILKFHRLGRTSFRQVRNKREYKTGNNCSWIYLNRISATREYCTMKELFNAKLVVPTPLGHNRGAVAMEYINSVPLFKFSKDVLENGAATVLYKQARDLLINISQLGLVHGDFNEFNLLVEVDKQDELKINDETLSDEDESSDEDSWVDDDNSESEEDKSLSVEELDELSNDNENQICPYFDQDVATFKLRMIDFPQVISRDNKMAQEIYARDRLGLVNFFEKFTIIEESDFPPENIDEIERTDFLDVKLKAPGYSRNHKLNHDSDDEHESEKPTNKNKLSDIINRVSKQAKRDQQKQRRPKIDKQMRNTRKQETRREMNSDLFF